MANEIDVNLDTFDLDQNNNIAIEEISFQIAKSIAQYALPKAHGSIIPIGMRKSIVARVRGTVIGSEYDDLRSKLDSLKNALDSTSEVKLTTDDDRYLKGQFQNFGYSYRVLRRLAEFNFDFIASYPFWLAASITTDFRTPVSGVGYVLNNPGNAYARVKVTITAGAGAISNDIKLQNSTTGELFQYRGNLNSSKALVVNNRLDQDDLTVENDGTDDIVNFEGDFITLAPGNNTIVWTSGASSPTVAIAYRETYK